MRRSLLCCVVVMSVALVAGAQVPAVGTLTTPQPHAPGTVVIPDSFLRPWDAVTIFFDRDLGAAAGSAEDHPERYVTVRPFHPGAFTWVNPRTLQFRPADAWSPLARYSFTVGEHEKVLSTLMAPPTATVPAAGASGLNPVQAITLSFADPIAADDLARMVRIELKPLPGVGAGAARWLDREDFIVKTMERAAPSAPARYVLTLATPIPLATRAVVHLRLSLDDSSPDSFAELSFTTAEPFRVLSVGARRHRYPVTPDGSTYTADQALDAGSDSRTVVVELSAPPAELSPVAARQLVRFTPAVDKLSYRMSGRLLEIDGDFQWDTVYRVDIARCSLEDRNGRPLEIRGTSSVHLYFPRRPAYLQWSASQGVVERYGPRMVPVEGRGHSRFDLRVVPVDPLDRSFWPFPERPVVVDESQRPPGPGEAPHAFNELRHISENELRQQLSALGSPPVSELVELPLKREGSAASFGLDLGRQLARLGGERAPGHYLVGLRPLDSGSTRQWMRVQVTDLCLSTFEEPHAVRFVVSSLASGEPVAGAEVRVEVADRGRSAESWRVHLSGTTDGSGSLVAEPRSCDTCSVLRIVVTKGDDVLVLDPTRPPDGYADNSWFETSGSWLQWTTAGSSWRGPQAEEVSHLFTERPIYRPDEPVHLKGYVRERFKGRLAAIPLHKTFVVVAGPGNLEWRFPVELSELGSFSWDFVADDRPTGEYRAHLEGWRTDRDGPYRSEEVSFQLEAYRLPRFEVNLHSPDQVPLDEAFRVTLTATYYAGGRVADRPVSWRITQFPHTWQPAGHEGFHFSSDGRFSATGRFDATAAVVRDDLTDEEGSAVIDLDPTLEATAQPRRYVVEATVTGADDQTVTATRSVVALPPFVLGLKLPRYLERAALLEPELMVVGGDGKPIAGQQLTLRLKHRQWHSYLQASDFSDGEARYITEVVDETVSETTLVSTGEVQRVSLPIDAAGVYVVELEAADRIGRSQMVAVDLYAGGDEPVSWSRPTSRNFKVSTDKERYDPGDEAVFILESPFQRARAMVVVEAPEGNRYQWLEVTGGSATFRLPVQATWTPRMPVHFVLMRGRVEGTKPIPGSATDLGKPATLANTTWMEVNPRGNRLEVTLEHPERALPGQEIEVGIRLSDPDGNPLSGEVTLWLVDQAVLALGREQRLDPLPDFLTPVQSYLELRDTRDLPFGELPFAESPGGGEGAMEEKSILDRASVRRNFQPVPFWDPRIMVGPDGTATVRVALPDNLTNFKLRAKAVSGLERFGFATGHLAVRLPLIVQPSLPRFVRPGDAFTATAIGRVVEGEGGAGAAEIAVEGVVLEGAARRELVWEANRPQRIDFAVSVPTPEYTEHGTPAVEEVRFTVGVERAADGATDAFELRLPIREDRRRVTERLLAELAPGDPVELPTVSGEARPGTIRRSVLVSNQPALVRMAAGLNFLMEYPFGCTEQRMSRARAGMALTKFRELLRMQADPGQLERTVNGVLEWLPATIDDSGLVGYWPGSRGYVSLTAWALEFVVEAETAGFSVDPELRSALERPLTQALRSDYSRFIDGESFAERCWALSALARAGRFNPAYAAELARKAQFLNLEASAQVLQSMMAPGGGADGATAELADKLWQGVVIRLWQDREVYGGLQDRGTARNGLILPSETRTVAEMTRALAVRAGTDPRLQILVNGLVTLGRGDGWGSTNANASALLALAEVLDSAMPGDPLRSLELQAAGASHPLRLDPGNPVGYYTDGAEGAWRITLAASTAAGLPTVVRAESSWIPAPAGSTVVAESAGFVVSRVLDLVRGDELPPERFPVEQAGASIELAVGDVVEDHVTVVNPADRYYVAVVVPLAAGMEPLNPRLATAPPEARPSASLSLEPAYAAYMDDHVAFYYDELPKGSYDFYFRTRATVPGRFIQPPAAAEMMYDGAVRGHGHGALVVITAHEEVE